jgi:hypothetical protein
VVPTASAQDRTPTPSAEELWRTYPLNPTPDPGTTPDATAQPTPAAHREPTPTSEPRASALTTLLVLLAVATPGGVAVFLIRRRRRSSERSPAAERAAPAAPAPKAPRLLDARRNGHDEPRRQPALPPDPTRRWTAEIDWRQSGACCRFRVLASDDEGETTTIAESRSLNWPPTGDESLRAMTDAAERLERLLIAGGWRRLQPGAAWYAKRFSWRAVAPADTTSPPSYGTARWRCEIAWTQDEDGARLEAIARGPSRKRGQAIGASATFGEWLAEPDPSSREHVAELARLSAALEATGWVASGSGTSWYALRFVWPDDGPPPAQIVQVPSMADAR